MNISGWIILSVFGKEIDRFYYPDRVSRAKKIIRWAEVYKAFGLTIIPDEYTEVVKENTQGKTYKTLKPITK